MKPQGVTCSGVDEKSEVKMPSTSKPTQEAMSHVKATILCETQSAGPYQFRPSTQGE